LFFLSFTVTMFFLSSPSRAQQPAPKPEPATPPQESAPRKVNPETEVEKALAARPSEAPQVLRDLNSALEGLVARVSPAVVQIQVTGYGAVEESNRSQTALIARQHAIGSGV